jgi:hypothetical protein
LKEWYSQPGDNLETKVDDFIVDIVRENQLIEIQTGNFPAIKSKIKELIKSYKVRLIHPIPYLKWIIRLNKNGEVVGRRRSPKRGRIEELFYELVYMPRFVRNPSFEIEVVLVNEESYLIDDGKGSWRRRRWSIFDRKLINVHKAHVFKTPSDYLQLFPRSLPIEFTTRDLANKSKLRIRLAQKMVYCLREIELLEVIGKKGKAKVYRKQASAHSQL